MPQLVLVLIFATALVILAVVLVAPHRRNGRLARNDAGTYGGDGGGTPMFSGGGGDGGGYDCGAGDAGGGCDGGGDGGGD